MKVKNKLYINMLVTLTGIGVIGGFSLVGITSVQRNLSLLTEHSTPYQLKTLDLQRTLQEHTSNLLKIGSSTTQQELKTNEDETEKSLAEVHRVSSELSAIKGGSNETERTTEIENITQEMIATTRKRLQTEESALTASQTMSKKLLFTSGKLKEMDGSIKKVQGSAFNQLSSSNEGVRKITTRLKDVQRVKDLLKDLKFSAIEIAAATNKNELTVAQNRYNMTVRWIVNHELIKTSSIDAARSVSETIPDITKLVTGPEGLIALKGRDFLQSDEAVRNSFQNIQRAVMQKIADLSVAMEDQVEKAIETTSAENRKFDDSFKGSKAANEILSMTSNIVSLSFNIESQISLLFGVRNFKDLDILNAEIQSKFAALESAEKTVLGMLNTSGRTADGKIINDAKTAHNEIKELLWGKDGLVGKIRDKITVVERATALNERLKEYVAKQRETGKQGVSSAQAEQEKTVSSVNRIVRTNITSTAVLGILIFVLGVVFSRMLERSISKPITELGNLAERFAEGDFRARMDDSSKDEFGLLAGHFNHASAQLGEMTSLVNDSSGSMAASAEELSAASTEVNRGAGRIAEMTQEITAKTSQANILMSEAVQVINNSNDSMNTLIGAMKEIATTSSEAHSIINTINAVAFQTKLLSLNAAVEAARAGTAGEGFAVVAEEVKKLAAKADEASKNTARLIEEIVRKINHGQTLVGETSVAFDKVTSISNKESAIIDEITHYSKEQAMEIQHVYQAIMEMEKVAQQNSEEAQKLAATAEMFKTGAEKT